MGNGTRIRNTKKGLSFSPFFFVAKLAGAAPTNLLRNTLQTEQVNSPGSTSVAPSIIFLKKHGTVAYANLYHSFCFIIFPC